MLCNYFNSNGTWLVRSNEAGTSWSPPESLVASSNYYVSSPARLLADGHLAMGLYYVNSSKTWANGAVTLSDDNGATWSSPVNIPTSVRLDAETDVIQLKDNSLWAVERNNSSSSPMYFSTSADEGASWTNSKPLDFHGESPYLWRSEQGVVLLGYRSLIGGVYSTALRYSLDECASWSDEITIDALGGAYTSMVNLDDGSVLVAYFDKMGDAPADIRVRTITITGVPEPGALALLATGLLGLLFYAWRKRKLSTVGAAV